MGIIYSQMVAFRLQNGTILSGIKIADMSERRHEKTTYIPRKKEADICLNCCKDICKGNCKKVKRL